MRLGTEPEGMQHAGGSRLGTGQSGQSDSKESSTCSSSSSPSAACLHVQQAQLSCESEGENGHDYQLGMACSWLAIW